MSLLDKINESISELDDKNSSKYTNHEKSGNIEEKYIDTFQENKKLKKQLKKAKDINTNNNREINELKSLIHNYSSQIDTLIKSYDERINYLNNQISFEKEINEKYLIKLIKANQDLNSNIIEYKDKQILDNKELISLLNNKQDLLLEIKQETDGITLIKDFINHKEDEYKSFINELGKNSSSINELINQINKQENNIHKILSHENEILEKIHEINSNINFEDMKSIFVDNKREIREATDKIIKGYNNSSEKIIDELLERIKKDNNSKLISDIYDKSCITKIEILDKISDDLRSGNYVNLIAYKKIKDLDLFDEIYYKHNYDYNLDIDPLLHFIYKGYEENKKPSKEFNPLEYKQSHKNIKNSLLNPLVYFVTKGINEGNIKINKDFEEVKHINKYVVDEEIENFSNRGVKKNKRKPRLIVSISSTPEHMNDLHYTLYSLLNQQLKADKVILWLNEEEYPNQELDLPRKILKFKQNGLSIRFTKDYKNFNTIIPVLKKYPNDIIITANDNIYYPQNWLKTLYEYYKLHPENIIAFKTSTITLDSENNIDKYENWQLNNNQKNVSYHNFASHKAGIIYPPKALHEDFTNEEKFNNYTDNIDVILWAMTILNQNKIISANNLCDELTYVNPIRETNLINNYNKDNQININTSIKNIVNKYPEIINIINEEEN